MHYTTCSKEVDDSMLWPTHEEMTQLVHKLAYLIPKNSNGSLKHKDLDIVRTEIIDFNSC